MASCKSETVCGIPAMAANGRDLFLQMIRPFSVYVNIFSQPQIN